MKKNRSRWAVLLVLIVLFGCQPPSETPDQPATTEGSVTTEIPGVTEAPSVTEEPATETEQLQKGRWEELAIFPHKKDGVIPGLKGGVHGDGTGGAYGVSSFRVWNGKFYLLDNANKNILIVKSRDDVETIKLFPDGWYQDLLVNGNAGYILLTGDTVIKTHADGVPISESTMGGNTAAKFLPPRNGRVTVLSHVGPLERDVTVEEVTDPVLPDYTITSDEKSATIAWEEDGVEKSIPLQFDVGFAEVEVLAQKEDGLLVAKMETSPNTTGITTEQHIVFVDWEGNETEYLRVPLEKMAAPPTRYLASDGEEVYLLVVGDGWTGIYKGVLGKEKESLLY